MNSKCAGWVRRGCRPQFRPTNHTPPGRRRKPLLAQTSATTRNSTARRRLAKTALVMRGYRFDSGRRFQDWVSDTAPPIATFLLPSSLIKMSSESCRRSPRLAGRRRLCRARWCRGGILGLAHRGAKIAQPLRMDAMRMTPSTVPEIRPTPPSKEVPPMTTAAMASRRRSSPTVPDPASSLAATIRPATPSTNDKESQELADAAGVPMAALGETATSQKDTG